jgi:hypothetical protein
LCLIHRPEAIVSNILWTGKGHDRFIILIEDCDLTNPVHVQQSHINKLHQMLKLEEETASTIIVIWVVFWVLWVLNNQKVAKWFTIGEWCIRLATTTNARATWSTKLIRRTKIRVITRID